MYDSDIANMGIPEKIFKTADDCRQLNILLSSLCEVMYKILSRKKILIEFPVITQHWLRSAQPKFWS